VYVKGREGAEKIGLNGKAHNKEGGEEKK